MMTFTLLCLAIGEPPQAPPLRITYSEFRSRVEKLPPGQTLTLSVGSDHPGAIRCRDEKTTGIADGVYSCWFDGTQAKMRRIEPPATTSGNAIPNTLRPWYNDPKCVGNT